MAEQDDSLLWMDEDEEAEGGVEAANAEAKEGQGGQAVAQLEAELQRTRQELSDVRKDLAAKVSVGEGQACMSSRL